jgi:hypothetical protein
LDARSDAAGANALIVCDSVAQARQKAFSQFSQLGRRRGDAAAAQRRPVLQQRRTWVAMASGGALRKGDPPVARRPDASLRQGGAFGFV